MNRFDFSPLYRSTVGFDRLFHLLDSAPALDGAAGGYPPYNIERRGENDYRITVAVAGFSQDDLTIEVRDDVLTVTGRKGDAQNADETKVLHRGIASRAFERRFQLADHVIVRDAALENGLLNIDLIREVPESLKPRRIDIRDGAGTAPALEGRAAA